MAFYAINNHAGDELIAIFAGGVAIPLHVDPFVCMNKIGFIRRSNSFIHFYDEHHYIFLSIKYQDETEALEHLKKFSDMGIEHSL